MARYFYKTSKFVTLKTPNMTYDKIRHYMGNNQLFNFIGQQDQYYLKTNITQLQTMINERQTEWNGCTPINYVAEMFYLKSRLN